MDENFKIFEILQNHKVPFIVFGGHAVNYYGYIRATEDFDIIFLRNSQSEVFLLNALKEINAFWITNEIDYNTGIEKTKVVDESYISNNHLMMIGSDLGYIDIFDFIPGYENENPKILLKDASLFNGISVVSLDWLIKIKQKSLRPKDLLDLEELNLL